MEVGDLLLTAARAIAVFAVMLVVIRTLGKRTVGSFAAFDLIVALMLGEVVDEIIYGDVGFLKGTVAILVIAGAQTGNAWLSWRHHGWDRILEGTPTVVIRQGRLQDDGMRAERMHAKDVVAHLRGQGVRDVREVDLAIVEDDGSVSVLKRPWAETPTKADLDRHAARAKDRDTGGRGEPVGAERTDDPQWM